MSQPARPRFAAAIAIAPLAAPTAVFIGLVVRAVIVAPSGRAVGTMPAAHTPMAVALWLFILLFFGAPPSYLATVLVLWPAARALADRGRFTWTSVTLLAGLSGAGTLPAYLHILEPRGEIHLFTGAGFVAGAATGLAFWFLARRQGGRVGQ